ncbi:MAG: radical SAM protein [Candidatus Omnitrophica bacterium]|nr:radical SAM protein [Candidatus Omnitrophota bacterium]
MTVHHINRTDWLQTPKQEPRGYIQPKNIAELWFHTGTICNLSCPFCLEGSKPGDNRLNQISLEDVKPFVQEGVSLGVQKFSFTGGEPFVVKDMVKILDYVLDFAPCLVLTNATQPLNRRLEEVKNLRNKAYPVSFRVSLDYADPKRHDASRGEGNFELSLNTLGQLHQLGFKVSIARQREAGEDVKKKDKAFQKYFKHANLPEDTRIVSFPDFQAPGSIAKVPFITENCMTMYHSEESRDAFMCSFSKMVVKINGKMRVYACTLVDDDLDYDLGENLSAAMKVRVMLKHHRCYSCFAQGASCSEAM